MGDSVPIRAVVEILALVGSVIWIVIYRHALAIRPARMGVLLRGRAVVFFSFALNVTLMGVAILLGIGSPGLIALWRSVTRVHAQLLVVIIGIDILWNEFRGSPRG